MVKGGAYRVTAAKLAELADDPDVEYISPDHTVQGTMEYAEPTVRADIAMQYGYIGTGIGELFKPWFRNGFPGVDPFQECRRPR